MRKINIKELENLFDLKDFDIPKLEHDYYIVSDEEEFFCVGFLNGRKNTYTILYFFNKTIEKTSYALIKTVSYFIKNEIGVDIVLKLNYESQKRKYIGIKLLFNTSEVFLAENIVRVDFLSVKKN